MRLGDSFNEYAMRPGLRTVGQQEHQQSAQGSVESTTWLVMSEMRRMTEEIRLCDKRKDEDIRRLIADCQRKDEIIFSLIAAIKEQMASPLSMTSESGFPTAQKSPVKMTQIQSRAHKCLHT